RVLAQNGAQATRKAHVDFGIDLGLADAVEVVLDRILNRHDVATAVVDPGNSGIQCCGFAGTGGASNQQNAMGFVDQFVDVLQCCCRHAQLRQVEASGLLVEQTQNDALAVAGRDGGYADIHRPPGNADGNTAILGYALFGNVQTRHDFDPRDKA